MNSTKHYCPECDQLLINNSPWCNLCQRKHFEENFDNWSSGDKDIDDFIKYTQINAQEYDQYLEWIPFSEFTNVIREARTLFSANWKKGPNDTWDSIEKKYVSERGFIKVALTSIEKISTIFLKELKINYYFRTKNGLIIRLFGVTKERVTGNFMIVCETVEWDVRHYVSHHHTRLTWQSKIFILYAIASALEIKSVNFFQGRFEIQSSSVKSHVEVIVNELGLGKEKESIPVIGNYKYDLLPFIAPEILNGEDYNFKVDVYTFGILMCEFSSNRPAFYNIPHDAKLKLDICNGLRPKISVDTPKCFGELMQKCWSFNAQERPTISEVVKTLSEWHDYGINKDHFIIAESKRIEQVLAKGLDPDPTGKMITPSKIHPQAIYTSRILKFPTLHISNISFNKKMSEENELNNQDSFMFIRDESFFSTNPHMN